jgi:hypothetical protein
VLKFLLIVLLIILIVRFFNRLSVSTYVYTNDRGQNDPGQSHKEGSVTVDNNIKPEKRISKDEGEYVDYEEVK